MATIEKIKQIIAEQLNKPVEELTDDKEVVKDLGADSLDVVELLMNIEEEFNITVPEDVAVNIKTIGDIVKIIEEKQ